MTHISRFGRPILATAAFLTLGYGTLDVNTSAPKKMWSFENQNKTNITTTVTDSSYAVNTATTFVVKKDVTETVKAPAKTVTKKAAKVKKQKALPENVEEITFGPRKKYKPKFNLNDTQGEATVVVAEIVPQKSVVAPFEKPFSDSAEADSINIAEVAPETPWDDVAATAQAEAVSFIGPEMYQGDFFADSISLNKDVFPEIEKPEVDDIYFASLPFVGPEVYNPNIPEEVQPQIEVLDVNAHQVTANKNAAAPEILYVTPIKVAPQGKVLQKPIAEIKHKRGSMTHDEIIALIPEYRNFDPGNGLGRYTKLQKDSIYYAMTLDLVLQNLPDEKFIDKSAFIKLARVESAGWQPGIKCPTSSAMGYYQFVSGTAKNIGNETGVKIPRTKSELESPAGIFAQHYNATAFYQKNVDYILKNEAARKLQGKKPVLGDTYMSKVDNSRYGLVDLSAESLALSLWSGFDYYDNLASKVDAHRSNSMPLILPNHRGQKFGKYPAFATQDAKHRKAHQSWEEKLRSKGYEFVQASYSDVVYPQETFLANTVSTIVPEFLKNIQVDTIKNKRAKPLKLDVNFADMTRALSSGGAIANISKIRTYN